MRRLASSALLVLAAAATLPGCAAQTGSSSRFQGEQKAVAKVVDDLAEAGRRKNPRKICTEILAQSLVTELRTAGGDCVSEMTKAIDDADDFDLSVQSVQIQGTQARAVVKQGSKGPTATFEFAKEGGRWRATALGH